MPRTSEGRSLLNYFFRQPSSGTRGQAVGEDRPVDGNVPSRNGLAGREVHASGNGTAPSNHDCPPFLREIIVDLVSSQNGTQSTQPTSGNGQLNLGVSDQASDRLIVPLWKRVLDLSLVLLTLPFWLPLMICTMVWISLVSPGPIFYRQERVGFRRRHFVIFKFRTMHVNAETRSHAEYFAQLMEQDCPMTKLDAGGDPRLIAFGWLIRAIGLDELPQIFNIIRGEMSLVGPRPCLPHEFARYEPWQQERVNALPGLTGYWQVNGKNKTTFSEMIAMDIFYSRNVSPGFDLAIILRTIPALLEQTRESRSVQRAESPKTTLSTAPSQKL